MNLQLKNPKPLSEEKLTQLEINLKIKLQEDYRIFLKNNNEGSLENLYCFDRLINGQVQGITLDSFLTINEIYEMNDNLRDMDLYAGLLIIAKSIASPIICIGTNKSNFGEIIVLDWDFGANVQADSFEKFVSSLRLCN